MTWHGVLEAIAAAILVGVGVGLVLLSWLRRPRLNPTRVAVPIDTLRAGVRARATLAAAAFSLAAGAIHFAVAPEHYTLSVLEGSAFASLALFQTGSALRLLSPGRKAFGFITIVVNFGAVGVWLMSRTIGVPLGHVESIGEPDVASTAFELLLVILVVFRRRIGQLDAPAAQRAATIAGIGFIPMLGVMGLLTLLAVAGPQPVHEHGSGADRPPATATPSVMLDSDEPAELKTADSPHRVSPTG